MRRNFELGEVRMAFWDAVAHETWAEDGCESTSDFVAEGRADGTSTLVGHPIALSDESTTGDRVREVLQSWVRVERFGWSGLLKTVSQRQNPRLIRRQHTLEYLKALKNGVMRVKPVW